MSDPKRSFCKSLFFGDIPEDLVFPFPRIDRAERERVRTLLAGLQRLGHQVINARRSDQEGAPSPTTELALQGLRSLGFFGLQIPREYGGQGLSLAATCRLLQELAALDQSLALTLTAHLFLGAGAILSFGTTAQKAHYLPALASGERLCGFCLTEPLAGSDAASIRTRAHLVPPQAPGAEAGYRLTGTKVWVTNGGSADLFVLLAQTDVLRDGAPADRISAFLVERGPGVRSGAEEPKLGMRATSITALYLDDVPAGAGAVLGGVGGGFKVAMETLSRARPALAASCVGAARELLRLTRQHATTRRQFGRLVSSFGMIKDKVAQMQIDLYAAESLVYLTCGLWDHQAPQRNGPGRGVDDSLEAACTKVFASEMLWRTVQQSLDIMAGAGFSRDYPQERYLRDSRAPLLFLGTNEILRCYIALTGLQGPGEQLAKLSDAIKYPLRGYGLVVDSLLDRVKVAATGGAALTLHHPRLKKEAVLIEDDVDSLARAVERVLRKHERQISEMQYVQRRMADVLIQLYAMVAVVSRASAALTAASRLSGGTPSVMLHTDELDREVRLARAFCLRAHEQIRATLEQMVENDDELRKSLADSAYHGRSYPFDALLGERDD